MTRHCDFSVQARTSAPPSTVYRLLRDGATWPRWSPIDSFTLEREGSEGGESLGAIRVFRTGTVHSRELLVELDVDRRLSYTALSGLPLRDHRADVDLTGLADGTQITWREQFTARVPGMGWLLKRLLRRFVQRCVAGLALGAASAPADSHQPLLDRATR
jgi:hypothetical protein